MADYENMTIPELEAEVNRIEGIVRTNRSEQKKVHDVAEAKRRLIPVSATSKDQFVLDAKNISGSLRNLPAPLAAEIKKELEGGN